MARRRVAPHTWPALTLALLLALLLPSLARAGKRAVIPPGQEAQVRELVEQALSAARAAGDLPVELGEAVDLHVEEDRVRVTLHGAADDPRAELPRLLVGHPDATAPWLREAAAPGVVIECGPADAPRPCRREEAAAWGPLAGRLAEARAPRVDRIWQLIEDDPPPGSAPSSTAPGPPQREGVWLDRGAALAALLLGLGLALFGLGEARGREHAIRWPELAGLGLALLAFIAATLQLTPLLPLHEHNSFIARSDCAIDPGCLDDPAAAWNMTTMHVYGAVLQALPYRASSLSLASLACSVIVLILLWALARVLARALGQGRLAPVVGLSAVAVLAVHPVAWRLASSATFMPYAIAWTLAAALAGLWASLACAEASRRSQLAGALAWIVAAICLAIACGGNFVQLTLGACLGLAPLCWTPAWRPQQRWRAALIRAALVGLVALAAFALIATADYLAGYERAFVEDGFDERGDLGKIRENFHLMLLDGEITGGLWWVPLLLAPAWLWPAETETKTDGRRRWLDPLRLFAPLIYAFVVPAAFFGLGADEIAGGGYPVGFIHHQWELSFSALGVGLGMAWLVARLERWPLHELGPLRGRVPARARWAWVLPALFTALAAALGPRAKQGWRLATGSRVLERELVALERSFTELPEHDLLIVPPAILEPSTDAPTRWDPIEVVFPAGFYRAAMVGRGLSPAPVLRLDRFLSADLPRELEPALSESLREGRLGEDARVLVYVGSSLRSYQPHEIEGGAVHESLERRPLRVLRDSWSLEPARTFWVATAQHEGISARLGADRQAELELGFYWLRSAGVTR